MTDTKRDLSADLERVQTELDKATEANEFMRATLRMVVRETTDSTIRAIAQAGLDLDEHGAAGCAQMRGDGPVQE